MSKAAGRATRSQQLDLSHLGFSLGALSRQAGVETKNIKEGFAADIAQHHTKRESSNRRTEHHQHTYVKFHSGPSNPNILPFRAVRSRFQCAIVTDSSLTLTLISVAE